MSISYKEAFENFTPVVNENVPEDVAENWCQGLIKHDEAV